MARIIIADDDPTTIFLVRSLLEQAGHIVGALGDGEGVAQVTARKMPDLLILDCSMPGTTGVEALRAVRAQTGGSVPVMMLTGRTSRADEAIAYQAGADDYVRKPFDPDQLLVRVDALLGAGQVRRHA